MTNKKALITNINFENDLQRLFIPADMTDVISWLKEYDDKDYTEKQATEAYIRTWLFEKVALTYHAHFNEKMIVLDKTIGQLWSLDALDQNHGCYKLIEIEIDYSSKRTLEITDDDLEMTDYDYQLAVFDRLRSELPINITIL